jgi:hypothetical protein
MTTSKRTFTGLVPTQINGLHGTTEGQRHDIFTRLQPSSTTEGTKPGNASAGSILASDSTVHDGSIAKSGRWM